jgi:hypothetical protein
MYDMKTDSLEHMLECRICGKKFRKMPQLAGHYRMHAQASLL